MSRVVNTGVAATVNIANERSLSSSSSSESLSARSPIRVPYIPASAMSQPAVRVGGAGGKNVGEKDEGGGGGGGGGDVGSRRRGVVGTSVLPSPPLTRVGTNESESTQAGVMGRGVSAEEEKEVDIAAWRESTQVTGEGNNVGVEEEEGRESALDGELVFVSPEAGEESGEDPEEDMLSEAEGNVSPVSETGKDPSRPLKIDIRSTAASPPPIWEIIQPGSTDDHPDEADITSQQHAADMLVSKAMSSKRLIPKSAYYYGPPPANSAFGTKPIGQIGVHHPREVVRIERDYTGGELIQFAHVYPLEFEGRISATRFLESINAVNEILISAHSLRSSFVDNALSFFTLQLSRLMKTSHYEKEMQRLKHLIDRLNAEMFNPVGLNMIWPRKVAFMFLEIEYY